MREFDPEGKYADVISEWIKKQNAIAQSAVFQDQGLSFTIVGEDNVPKALQAEEVIQPVTRLLKASDHPFHALSLVGGLDISTFPDGDKAIVQLVVLSFPDLKVVDTVSELVSIDEPYIPSFLAMREAKPLVTLLEAYKKERPEQFPQVLLVDGNGRLHERQAGLAVSIGVALDMPCIGCGKEYYPVPTPAFGEQAAFRSSQKDFRNKARELLLTKGDYLPIPDPTGNQVIGAAIRTSSSKEPTRPLFVSSGHRIGLRSAMLLAMACTREGKLPVPIREADNRSRAQVKAAMSRGDST